MGNSSSKRKSKHTRETDLVLTPGGWRPKSKVHQIEPGQHIDAGGGRLKIVDTATGKIIKDLGEIPEVASEPKKHGSGTNRRKTKQKQTKKTNREKGEEYE